MEPIRCSSSEIDFWVKGPPFRAAVGLVCTLSVLGSLLIIFSYVSFKSLQSRARLILVHLSIVDLGVGLSNLVGNVIYFDRFYFSAIEVPIIMNDTNTTAMPCVTYHQPNNTIIRNLCEAQAFIAHYFTQASILWTISLAIFLYLLIVHNTTNLAKYSLRISYVLCYFLPLMVCVWLLKTERFGYSPANTGWCSIVIINAETTKADKFAAAFGYDLWTYLGMVLVPILYLAVQLYIREKLRQTKLYLPQAEGRFWEAVHILDYNFLLIPIVFTLLRMWTCIVDLVFVYIQVDQSPVWVNIAFVYLAAIGDSAQGAANAVLFVLLTKRVRKTIFSLSYWKLKLKCCKCDHHIEDRGERDPLLGQGAGKLYTEFEASQSSYPDSDLFTPAKASGEESNVFTFPVRNVN